MIKWWIRFTCGCEVNVGESVGKVDNLGEYRVCCGVEKRVGGPLEVYRVE